MSASTTVPTPPGPPGLPDLPPFSAAAVESPHLSETGREIRDRVRELIPLIRSEALECERTGALTEPVLTALDSAGIYKLTIPLELGGLALGARDLVEVHAALGEADGSAGWSAFVGIGIRNLLAFPTEVLDEIFAGVESWVGPLVVGASVFSTTVGDARKVDGGWLVKGFWPFGSGCKHAAWAVVGIAYDPALGSGRGMVVLEREQFEIVDDWHVMGLSGTSSNSLRVREEVFVPDHRFVDAAEFPARLDSVQSRYDGVAFRQGGLALMLATALANVSIALGMARGALAAVAEQTPTKKPFNLPYPNLAEMPTVQLRVGQAQAMIDTAAAVIEGYADQVDSRSLAGVPFTPVDESRISLAVAYAANLCADAIDLLQKAVGSSTVVRKNVIQRFARDVRVLITHGAIRLDPLCEINGRRVLGLPPFAMFAGGLPDRSATPQAGPPAFPPR